MGPTIVDAGVLIGFLDDEDAHHQSAIEALAAAIARRDSLVLPASALAETLVAPARKGTEAVAKVREFIARVPMGIAPLDADVSEAAAVLRARHGSRLRLPDALVVATAQVLNADVLLTTDRRWPSADSMPFRGEIMVIGPTG